MDISMGFQLESPDVFVRKGLSEDELKHLIPSLRSVTKGYYVLRDCVSLGGLKHELGFHFQPRTGGFLNELEFFSFDFPDLQTSFQTYQTHLEKTFDAPTESEPGDEGFPSYAWRSIPGVEIVHFIFDRFGPEEHVRIKW
jgi:hypothetical protein